MPVASPIRYPASGLQRLVDGGQIPAPVLRWDFLRGEVARRLTCTRSGTDATYVGSDGVRRTAAANAPRLDFNPAIPGRCLGLLREPARTNLVLYSDDASNANWFKEGSVTISGTSIVVEGAGTSSHGITQGLTLAGSTTYAASAEALQIGRRYVQAICYPGGGSHVWATFDLEAGAVVETSTAAVAGMFRAQGGRWRCWLRFASAGSPSSPYVSWISADSPTGGLAPSIAGLSGQAFGIRAIQVESGHCPTSPIGTTSAGVARPADALALTGTAFSEVWNAAEGTLLVEATMAYAPPASATAFLAALNDGTTAERINLYVNEANAGLALFIADGGVQQTLVSIASTATYDGVPMRLAAAWRLNSARAAAAAGTLSTLDTSITMPTPTQIELGAQAGASASGTATPIHIRRMSYWRQRLPDAALRELTRVA